MDVGGIFLSELDPVVWVENYVGQTIYNNQAATIRAICNRSIRHVIAIHARQTGKTNSVASSCLNLGCKNTADDFGNILIFGPREGQAMIDLARIRTLAQFNPYFKEMIDWQSCTKSRIKFKDRVVDNSMKPGIFVQALSGAESASVEGESAGLIILEECQKISDKVVSEVILPMGGAWDAKIVKIGTPRFRNNFYQSYQDPSYTKCIFPWEECGILKRKGIVEVDGIDVSRYVLEMMPKIIKQEYWPDNPIVDYVGHIMHVFDMPSNMNPDDFRTQYKLDWLLDCDSFISEAELESLYGDHADMTEGIRSDQYYAGIDFAGGSLTDPNDDGRNDWSAISIIKKYPNGYKEVVFKDERYGTDYYTQFEWIKEVCDSANGLFPCQAVFVDATGCGSPALDTLRHMMPRTNVLGTMFSRTEPESKKNWKNAMCDHFKTQLTSGNVKYPRKDVTDNHQLFFKHFNEWGNLESKRTTNVNKIIRAPNGEHDDGPCSDILATMVADKLAHIKKVLKQGRTSRTAMPIVTQGMGTRATGVANAGTNNIESILGMRGMK